MDQQIIYTLGKDGCNYEFVCDAVIFFDNFSQRDKVAVKVFPLNRQYDDYFDFKYILLSEYRQVKVTDMFLDYKNYYQSKGLPEALILQLKYVYPEFQIISSSNKIRIVRNEWRSTAGTRVWERLVAVGRANYLEDIDTYLLV